MNTEINVLADWSDTQLVNFTKGNDFVQANGVEMSRRLKVSVETLDKSINEFNKISSRQAKLMLLLSVLMVVIAFLQLFSLIR